MCDPRPSALFLQNLKTRKLQWQAFAEGRVDAIPPLKERRMKPLKEHKVLTILGKAGSGKDTVADMVREYIYGTSASLLLSLRFADPLKDMACSLFGWDRTRMDELEYKEEILPGPETIRKAFPDTLGSFPVMCTRRAILMHLGTDVFRQMDPDVWVKAAVREAKIRAANSPVDGFVSTDCRFPNEQRALVNEFKKVHFVKLHRAGDSLQVSVASGHASEKLDILHADAEFHVQSGDMKRLREVAKLIADDFFPELGSF